MKIGWIGLGIMGSSMAQHLLKNGYDIYVHTRTKSKADDICAFGANWCKSPAELAGEVDYIFSMVGYPEEVEQVYFGTDGVFKNLKKGSILIDMTTSSPQVAEKIDQKALESCSFSLDAPVSGGDVGARNASLAIMCGGKKEIFEKVLLILQCMGKNIQFFGKAGSGQRVKMSNQILIASTMVGVVESMLYAERSGLDLNEVIKLIEKGAAGCWSLTELGPRIIKGNVEPGFFVKHFIKDMGIAIEDANRMELKLEGLNLVKKLYDQVSNLGYKEKGTQVLFKALKELN